MKNNLKNGVIIGTLIASLGIGGGIFIANNKSSERTSIKKTEDSQNTNNTNSKIYKNQDEIEMSIDYLNKCIDIAKNLDDKKELASLYIELGKLYSNISKDKELECYQKGVLMYKDLDII